MTACVVLLSSNETMLPRPDDFSITVSSLERSEAEMFLLTGISQEPCSCRLNEKEDLRNIPMGI